MLHSGPSALVAPLRDCQWCAHAAVFTAATQEPRSWPSCRAAQGSSLQNYGGGGSSGRPGGARRQNAQWEPR
eukprot:7451438-Pyramimonas_sp.AAC.1